MTKDGAFTGIGRQHMDNTGGGLTAYFQRRSAQFAKSELVPISNYINKKQPDVQHHHTGNKQHTNPGPILDGGVQKIGEGFFFFPQPPTGKRAKSKTKRTLNNENVGPAHGGNTERLRNSQTLATHKEGHMSRPRSTPSNKKAATHAVNASPEKFRSSAEGTTDPQKKIQIALKELNAVKKRAREAVAATDAITSQAMPVAQDDSRVRASSESNPLERFQKNKGKTSGGGGAEGQSTTSLQDKLRAAEKVMKNLYARNVELEGQLLDVMKTDAKPDTAASGAQSPGSLVEQGREIFGEKLVASLGIADKKMDPISDDMNFDKKQENHIKYVMKQRDDRITQLEQFIRLLQEKVTWCNGQMEKLSIKVNEADKAKRKMQMMEGTTSQYQEKYQNLLQEHKSVLSKKAKNIMKMSTLSSEARSLIGQLEAQLHVDGVERQIEQAMLNSKLFEMEQEKCDWFVERKLLQQDVDRLNQEIAKRDELETQIETCLAGVFQKVRELEIENSRLRNPLTHRPATSGALRPAGQEMPVAVS